MVYLANNMRIYSQQKEDAHSYFDPSIVSEVQGFLNNRNELIGKEDYHNLCKDLLKCIVKTHMEESVEGTYVVLGNVFNTAIDWMEKIEETHLSAQLKGLMRMQELKSWQREFARKLFSSLNPEKICFLTKHEIPYVYVFVSTPSTELAFQYSQLYYDFQENNQEPYFGLLVLGLNNFEQISSQDKTITVKSGDF